MALEGFVMTACVDARVSPGIPALRGPETHHGRVVHVAGGAGAHRASDSFMIFSSSRLAEKWLAATGGAPRIFGQERPGRWSRAPIASTGDTMKQSTRRAALWALAAVVAGLGTTQAAAQAEDAASYPSRPITIVVGFPPGGPTDIIARLVANGLSQAWGKPVVVENKPGAGSNIATEQVVRAAPDGYTLLVETIANATNMSVYKKLPYDTHRDLTPIVQFMASPSVLVTGPKVPATTLKELLALAKAQPGKLDYASTGVGGSPHLAGEMLKYRTGIDIVHIPYKGATPALNDLLAGHVAMGFMTSLGLGQHVQTGKLHAIAVASPKRLPDLPNVPTMAEAGLPNFNVLSWNGLAAPARTPRPIVDKLNAQVNRILAAPEVKKQLESLGGFPVGGTPDEFARYVDSEIRTWGAVVKAANFTLN
jgi:tripartite-type tricarboxylate transporter receptor subunit TctC